MIKAVRLTLALAALAAPAALAAGCGGVPGNAVAEVDGQSIEKSSYDHWVNVAARSSGQGAKATVPKPPDYAECIATKRKTTPKPAKGQPKVTDSQLKSQCKQEYEQLRDQVLQLLISFQWLEGEAKEQGIKVSDAEVKKSFDQQRKQSFPKDADYQKFLKDSGQSEADIMLQVKADLLASKIRDKVVKGKDKVSDAQIQDFYNKNKARFAQPERRDLLVVLTKGKAKAEAAKKALKSGQSWKAVAKKYSIDEASKAQGGKLPAQAKGTLEKQLDEAVFKAKKGDADRAGQDPVRQLPVQGHQGHPGVAADARAGQGDDQADAAVAEPAEGAGDVLQGLLQALEGEDRLPQGLRDPAVQAGSEGHADAQRAQPPAAAGAVGQLAPRSGDRAA